VKGLPKPPALPDVVWINPPQLGERARSNAEHRHSIHQLGVQNPLTHSESE